MTISIRNMTIYVLYCIYITISWHLVGHPFTSIFLEIFLYFVTLIAISFQLLRWPLALTSMCTKTCGHISSSPCLRWKSTVWSKISGTKQRRYSPEMQCCMPYISIGHVMLPWWPLLELVSWYHPIFVRSLQLTWRLGAHWFHVRVSDLQMSCSGLT